MVFHPMNSILGHTSVRIQSYEKLFPFKSNGILSIYLNDGIIQKHKQLA